MNHFYAIDFINNLDAHSHYGITSSIMIMSSSARAYAHTHHSYGLQLWSDVGISSFFTHFPEDVRGKYMKKGSTDCDYWDFHPKLFGSLCAIVTKRFVDVLNNLGVSDDEYYLKEILVGDNLDKLYLFFVPCWGISCINYCQSTFVHDDGHGDEIISIMSKEEHMAMIERSCYPRVKKAILSENLHNKDIISLQSCMYPLFSERLIDALRQNAIKGIRKVDGIEILA